jgi:hypothetical protein
MSTLIAAVRAKEGADRLRELLEMFEEHNLRGGDFDPRLGQEFINLGRDPRIRNGLTAVERRNVDGMILVIRSEFGFY